jgi:predicted dinucleotide-binding enzyme
MSSQPTIGVLGSGPMGRGFAELLSRAGYQVTLGTSRPTASALAALPDAVRIGTFREAAAGDVVFIAIVHGATRRLLTDLKSELAGKVLVSCNNAWLAQDYDAAGLSASLTEGSWMASLVPDSTVVRAFTHIDWPYLVPKATDEPGTYAVSYATDDADADAAIRRLITDMGYVPYSLGTLAESADLDVNGALWHFLFTPAQMRATLKGALVHS